MLPIGQNNPQKVKFDLYSEQLNGTAFVSSRSERQHAWLYRIFPSAAHGDIRKTDLNSDVSSRIGNGRVNRVAVY